MKIFSKLTSVLYKKEGIENLKYIQKKYKGKTLEDFRDWFDSKIPGKVQSRKNSYQAGIVHVKLYPTSGEIKVDSVQKL